MFRMVNGLQTNTPVLGKPWASGICLLILSTLIGLLLAEVGIRFWFPQQLILLDTGIWRPDEVFGYTHSEHTDIVMNTGEGPVRFVTDGLGFRVEERGDEGARHPRILMLGDSFVAGLNVSYDRTLGAVLETSMVAAGCSVRVENAGVSGWSPNHYLLQAKREISSRTYRVAVVCLYVGNDVIDHRVDSFKPREKSERRVFEWPERLSWNEVMHGLMLPLNDILEARSHLFVLVRRFVKDRAAFDSDAEQFSLRL